MCGDRVPHRGGRGPPRARSGSSSAGCEAHGTSAARSAAGGRTCLDPFQHGVHRAGKSGHLVVAGHRYPTGEVRPADLAHAHPDGLDRPQGAPHQPPHEGGEEPHHEGHAHKQRPGQRPGAVGHVVERRAHRSDRRAVGGTGHRARHHQEVVTRLEHRIERVVDPGPGESTSGGSVTRFAVDATTRAGAASTSWATVSSSPAGARARTTVPRGLRPRACRPRGSGSPRAPRQRPAVHDHQAEAGRPQHGDGDDQRGHQHYPEAHRADAGPPGQPVDCHGATRR